MLEKMKMLLDSVSAAGRQSVSMQRKLMLYLLCLVLAAFVFLLMLLTFTGMLSSADGAVENGLQIQLHNAQSDIHKRMESLTAQGIALSQRLSRLVEDELVQSGQSISQLSNDAQTLTELQMAAFEPLYGALQIADCSGAYFFLDATVNTDASPDGSSRSGIYLRLANVAVSNPVDPAVMLYRGIPELARKNGLQLHNRWNLEFDMEYLPEARLFLNTQIERLADSYCWTQRVHLKDTWEDALLLCVPVADVGGNVYGVCGFEVSALYFQLSFPVVETNFGPVSTVFVPAVQDSLALEKGLCGAGGIQLQEAADRAISTQRDKYFNIYGGPDGFVGMEHTLHTGNSETDWRVAVLLPMEHYNQYVSSSRRWLLGGFVLIFAGLLAAAFWMSQKYVRPITESLAALQAGQMDAPSIGISEIDEMFRFLEQQSRTEIISKETLPSGIAILFDHFVERTRNLTASERNIFQLYIEGYQISDIPGLTYASMSTVRKHNRSIYEKLEVASRDEMMLYIELLRRCGKLSEIYGMQKETPSKPGL
ncbi:hypothetical protein DW194_18795 [Subdoligranulum sp. AM16-9]|jgi:DNA-binding CsgD family transcriptional regulator|uniref:helix-turn-helix transcriptional regulator n=1 Tax=Ruthenibacterium lactatiformans TaxID=1550024 RepID=UPI000E3F7049|nr:hypothetical protein DW194_18795 [Subdoligranulum sp. AM16-9]